VRGPLNTWPLMHAPVQRRLAADAARPSYSSTKVPTSLGTTSPYTTTQHGNMPAEATARSQNRVRAAIRAT